MRTRKQELLRTYKVVSEFVDSLRVNDLTIGEVEEEITDFLDQYGDEFSLIPALVEKIRRDYHKPYVINIVTEILKQYDDGDVLDEVYELFGDPEIPDEIRAALLDVLSYYGVDTSDPVLGAHFQDIDAVHERAMESMLDQLVEHEELAGEILAHLIPMPKDLKMTLIQELAERGKERSLPLLAVFAEHPDTDVASVAIQELGNIRQGRAIWILENLINHQKNLKKDIDRSLRKLQFMGIELNENDISPSGEIYECYLSNIDGRGSQILFISRQLDTGKFGFVNLMLNEQQGIKDSIGATEIEEHLYENMMSQMKTELSTIQIDYEYAITLIKNALWQAIHHQKSIAPAFILRRSFFGNVDLTPTPYVPDLEKYGLSKVHKHAKKLLSKTGSLMNHQLFSEWWFDTIESYQFVKENQKKLNADGIGDEIVDDFIDHVIEKERENFLNRIAYTIEFLNMMKIKDKDRVWIDLVMTVWIALQEWEFSCTQIPYFHELAELTLFYVMENIEMGVESPETFVPEFT